MTTWLIPVIFWNIIGKSVVQTTENSIVLESPADIFYSLEERRCYALVYTDTVHISHTLNPPPHFQIINEGNRTDLVSDGCQISMQVPLQPGRQVLVAQNEAGHGDSLGILYLPQKIAPSAVKRTLQVTVTERVATAVYSVEATGSDVPEEFDHLRNGSIESGQFIKRFFYFDETSGQSDPCKNKLTVDDPSFSGFQLPTISKPKSSIQDGVHRITIEAATSRQRFSPQLITTLLKVTPILSGSLTITFAHDQGNYKSNLTPVSMDDWKSVWENPSEPLMIIYTPDQSGQDNVTKNPFQAFLKQVRLALQNIPAYFFFFSVLTTISIPLLPLVWLLRRRKRELVYIWPNLITPILLSTLLWVGPFGAMVVSFIVFAPDVEYSFIALWVAVWGSGLVVFLLSTPMTFSKQLAPILAKLANRQLASYLGALLLISVQIALSWFLLTNLYAIWHQPQILFLQGLFLAFVIWSLISTVTRIAQGLSIHRVWWVALIAVLTISAVPLRDTVSFFDPVTGWPMETGRRLFLAVIISLLPYMGLIVSLIFLKNKSGYSIQENDANSSIPKYMFVMLVGLTGALPEVGRVDVVVLLISPVPFIIAWLLFRYLLRPTPTPDMKTAVFNERQKLKTKVSNTSNWGGNMNSLSPDLSKRLRMALLECGPFNNNQQLQAIFIDTRLQAWYHRLPQSSSPMRLVDSTIAFLHDKYNDQKDNGLVLLLQVLSDHSHPADACHQRLADLANEIKGQQLLAEIANKSDPTVQQKDTPITQSSIKIMSFGPYKENWNNGLLGYRFGRNFGAALGLLYGFLLLFHIGDKLTTPFLLLILALLILPLFLRWMLAGFFLGYFFPRLPGLNGATKAFWLAGTIATSAFVYDLLFRVLSRGDFFIFLTIDVAVTILGIIGVGIAFDYRSMQQSNMNWRRFFTLYKPQYLFTFLLALITALSLTVVSITSGRAVALITDLVDTILRVS